MSKVTRKEFKPPVEEGHCMPSFTLEPTDSEGYEGESLEIRAKIEGIPAPKVQWRKGNWLSIDDGGRHTVKKDPETGNYSMEIKSCRSSDLGKYKVVAMNDYGEVTAFFQVKVSQKPKDGSNGFNVRLKHREKKAKVVKTQEEREKEIIEILKTADPKDYESICLQYGFYDFRYILHKLKEVKREEAPAPEFEAAKVLKGLRHITVNDEGTAVFEIHMEQANPNRQLRWLKDGELMQIPGEEKRHELRRVGNVYQLIIRNVKPEDAGSYTLEVGKERFTANLTIKERPLAFESELKDQKGTVKGRCVFECTVSRRNLKIAWLKDSKEIKFGGGLDRIQAVSEGRVHKLIIMELKKEDAAKYTARVDKLESSAVLTVSSAPVRFRNRLVDTEVKEKSTAYFECSVSNRDVDAQWFINGKSVTSTGRYKITHVGDKHSLFIEKVALTDSAAKVEVRVGDASCSATLNVNEKPIKVLKKMEDVKCRTGGKAEFTCEIDDRDQKNVKWFKEDKEIKIDKSKYEVLQRGGKHTLVIKNVTFDDEAHYTFQVRGVRLAATLACTNPPTVDKKFLERVRKDPLKFRAGTKARIIIPIIAKEPMTVSWTNGRVTLEERGRYHMEHSATEAVVEVQSCKISDSGEYEVTIVNENGDVTVSIPVRVVAKPNPPSGEIKFSEIQKNSVSMSWEEPVNMEIPFDNYIIEMQVEGSSTWKKLTTVSSKQTTCKATGLTTGKKHKFRVKTSNSEGESEPLESDNVTPLEPDQPPKVDESIIERLAKNPIVVNAGETATIRVPVKGNPPPSATWFHNDEEILPVKHHRAKKESSLKEVTLQITKCNRTDNGEYEGRIFNNVGGVVIKTKIVVNDVPAFKEGAKVKFDKVTSKDVQMSWDAPEDDGNQPVTGYDIERTISGTDKWQKVGETKAGKTNYTASNLTPGEKYEFRVKAKNSRGASAPINSAPVSCGSAVAPPTIDPKLFDELTKTPIKVKAGQTGRLKVPLSGEPIPTATWSKDGESLEGTPGAAPAGKPTPKPAGKPADVTPAGVPVFKEGATVKVDKVTRKEVKMSWEAPVDEGDQPLTGYEIEKSISGSDKWEKIGDTKPGTTSFTAGNCAPGETYVFRVKAKNIRGSSKPVLSSPVKTKSGPSVPAFKDGATVEVEKVTAKEVTMSWDAPDDDGDLPLTGYDIEKCKAGTDKWEKVGETKPKETKFTASNCATGETYIFRVKAKNSRGSSEPVTSRPVTCGDAPNVPAFNSDATVNFDKVSSNDVKMSWKAPEDNGNQPITGYEIEKSVYGTGKWDKVGETKPGTTDFTAGSCAPGETYLFRVKAKNKTGLSEPLTSSPVTCASRNGIPVFGKDATVKVDKSSPKAVKMSWDRPANDGDHPVTGYDIERAKAGTNQWEKVGETQPETTDFTSGDCAPGETYVFRVKAKNDRGTSEPLTSAPVTCKPGTSVPSFKDGAKVKVDKVSPKEVKMSWDAPTSDGDQPLSGYDIERKVAGRDVWEKVGETKPGTTGFTAAGCAPGETYVFRVTAKNSHGSSKPVTTEPVTCGSPKGVPVFAKDAKVTAENVSPKEVKMSWDAPANEGDKPVSGYVIEKSVAGSDKWEKVGDTKPGTTSFTASNCAPGETYLFRVKAKNPRGDSEPVTSAPVKCKSGTGVPTFKDNAKVKVDNSTPNKVKMTWDAPSKDGDQPVSSYDIEKAVAGTDNWEKVGETRPGTTGFTSKDCTPGETYVFRVKSKNSRGESKPVVSKPVRCRPKPSVPSFDDDAKVKVDKITPKEVKMSWDAPVKDGEKPLAGYDIERAIAGTDNWKKIGETKPETTGFTASNCAPGETYVFRVKAKNELGSSKPVTTSPVTCGTTNGVPAFARDAKVIAENVSPKEVKMSWDAPANEGDKPVSGYEIEKSVAGTDKWEKVGDTKPGTTSFTASNCAPGESYVFRVKAKNPRGTSAPITSAPVTCKSGTDVPSFKPGSKVKVDNSTPNEVKMTWDAPAKDGDQPLSGYDIEKSISGTDKWEKIGETQPEMTAFTAKNGEPGETYVFRVKAKNSRGSSKPVTSAPIAFKRGPGVPSFDDDAKVKVDKITPKEVKMSWDAPEKDGEKPLAGYDIERAIAGTDDWKKIGETKPETTGFTASNCAPGETYVFRVKAKNELGSSKPVTTSPVTCGTTNGVPAFARDAKVIAENVSPKEVKMSWDAPANEGDKPVSGYEIEKSVAGTDKWEKVGDTKPGTTSFTASNCAPGKSYVFRVKAKNPRGTSAPITSAPITCKSGTDVPSFKPGSKVKVDNSTPNEVKMTWDAPAKDGDQPLAGYDIEKSVPGTNKWEKIGETQPGTTGFTAKDGVPGETYVFRVKAKNCRGSSEPVTSAPISFKPGPAAPTSPAPLSPTGGLSKRDLHRMVKDTSDAAHAQLVIHACERTDSGKYICKLKNEAGELEIPLNVVVVDAPPAPTGEIEFSDISSKGVTVSWQSPADDGGSKIDHYVIEKKEEGRKNWTSVGKAPGANANSFKVKGVPSGKTYRFRIRAVNDIGDGQSLESEPVVLKDPFDAPSKIKGDIEFDTATDDSITISWPAVENDGGSAIQGYYVEKRKKGQSSWGRCNHDRPIRDRKYTATGLRFDNEYEFRVIAVNAAGEGIPSKPSQAFLARTPVDAPGEPSDLELVDSTNTSLTLAWKGTDQHGGAELLGYEIEIKEEHTEHWQLWTDGAVTGTSCILRGLKEGGSYNVRMRSVNRGARSKYYYYKGTMVATEVMMAPSFKITPELEACVRDGFRINAGSTIRINVPYTGRPKPHIVWKKNGEDLDETVEVVSSMGLEQMTIRNARGYHSGVYTISLSNSYGTETLKVPVTVYDVPTPPTGPLRVQNETDKGVTITWHPPKYDGGKQIRGYVIQTRDARGRDWQTVAQNIQRCEYVCDSLHKSRSYYFRVLAENEIGRSEPLESKTVVYIKQEVAKVQIEEIQYTEKDLRTPPQITVPMKPRIVPEGVKVTLSCSIGGKPHPQIKWFKDNTDITDNSNYFKENVIGLCRLVIKNVKPSDAGVYKVVAENPVGSATCQANLVVET